MVCTATYTVTAADAAAGRVTNVASARATDPGGATLPEVPSNEVEVPFAAVPPPTTTPPTTTPPPPPGPTPPDPTPTAPSPVELPATGAGRIGEMLLLAAGLLVAGGASIAVVRRRRPRRTIA
jgi:hypothetical protein